MAAQSAGEQPGVHEQAQATLEALLAEVIVAYMGVLDVLEVAPWSGEPLRGDNPGGNVRTLVFGPGGDGLVPDPRGPAPG